MGLNHFCPSDNVFPVQLNWVFTERLIHRYVRIIRYFIGLMINQILPRIASNIDFLFWFFAPQSLKIFVAVINKVKLL